MRKGIVELVCCALLPAGIVYAQAPVTLTVDTTKHEFAIPADFSGLGFETKSAVPNEYGVSGYFFTPENPQLVTLFQNIGLKNIRVGGGTVDGSGTGERCVSPTPTEKDIDQLFGFAKAAGVDVIYSVRLLNVDACKDPHLAEEDAAIAKYVWSKYRPTVTSLSIGNEPDVRQYHSYPGHPSDSAIFESTPGIAGSAYPSYLAAWRQFADVILKSVPDAKFSGPDTAVSSTSSFTPNSAAGVSWTLQFGRDLKNSGMMVEALQHHYVWGGPGNTTAQEAIDDMLSSAWDNGEAVGSQPAMNGGKADFHPYPFVYNRVLSGLVPLGIPYRMTEANDCLHGVVGASNGYAAALWALDYMHWWAAHHMAGVNFHNNPWLPTDTVVPDPNPCPRSGCKDYRITAKGYGIKAFDLGGHGYVMPVAIGNPAAMNLTAYAVGTDRDLYVTIINRTHTTTHDVEDATVTIDAKGFRAASAATMVLAGEEPGNAASMTATLGGALIPNNAPWRGSWTPLGRVENGLVTVTVKSTTAVVVKIRAAGANAGPVEQDQNGDLEVFTKGPGGRILHARDKNDSNDWRKSAWSELAGGITFQGMPAVIRNEDNTLEVFATAANGQVHHNRQMSPDGEWGGWELLGNERITDLAAAQNADGSVSVFGIGSNGDLWSNSESAPEVGWMGWRDLGGKRIEPGYAVHQDLSGRLHVFGTDRSGAVWHSAQTDSGNWTGWISLGGKVKPQLGVARNLDGQLEVFAVGFDGRMQHLQEAPDGKWSEWSTFGEMKVRPGFAVGQYSDGRLAVFVLSAELHNDLRTKQAGAKTTASTVWRITQDEPGGSFGRSTNLGSAELERIALGNDRNGRIQLFGFGEGGAVILHRQADSESGWSKVAGEACISNGSGRP